MIVVDDSPEVDHELFETDEVEGTEWVLIADDTPLDEHRRDELVERFQRTHHAGDDDLLADEDPEDGLEVDEDDDELETGGLELGHE